MDINISDACKKLYYRLLDVNVGSDDGEDLFADVENKFEIMEQVKECLSNFNNKSIDMITLKERLQEIKIINDVYNINNSFVERFSTLGTQISWLFEKENFEDFLYKNWEDVLKNDSMLRQSYRDNKKDYDEFN